MRVLILRRQRFGGIATYTDLLVSALDKVGVEAVIDDAEDWIPNETGLKTDRQVTKAVRAAARGFDLVHAFGYRAAWACGAAFGRSSWVYTAHDMPKTLHPHLIEKLSDAKAGLCSSRAVYDALTGAKAQRLRTVVPGLPLNRRTLDRAECRAMLGAAEDAFLMASAGRFCKEHSLHSIVYVADALPYHARLVVCGQGELETELRGIAHERVTFKTEPFAQQTAIAAADVVVVPSTVAGFSFTAIEAMLQGTAVALRRTGGLPEIAEDHRTGFFFDTDEELLDLLSHLCFKREQVREIGRAARERALVQFDIARTAAELRQAYEAALA